MNNIDHLKKKKVFLSFISKKKKKKEQYQSNTPKVFTKKKKKKLKIIEWYICRDGEDKNIFRNNISSTFNRIIHTLCHVIK